jgi:hypothetical protein
VLANDLALLQASLASLAAQRRQKGSRAGRLADIIASQEKLITIEEQRVDTPPAAQARAGLGRGRAGAPARRNPPISFQLICLEPRLTNRVSLRWGYCKCGPINGQRC